jgi:hypothetical protein
VRSLETLALWAVLTPPIMAIAERLPLDKARRSKSLGLHGLIAIGLSIADVVLDTLLIAWAVPLAPFWDRLIGQSAELEERFAEARLAALIRLGDRDQALAALVALSELLRAVIEVGGEARVPLEKELEWTERYSAIERIRFQDRLKTAIKVEKDAEHALVPALVLQPIVENAIRHGVEQRRGAGEVRIEAERVGGQLALSVHDAGEEAGGGEPARGFGLVFLDERAPAVRSGCSPRGSPRARRRPRRRRPDPCRAPAR